MRENPARQRKDSFVRLRMFSHPWRGEGRREHSYYVGHDAGGLSGPIDEVAVDPSGTFLDLRHSIEERCDGNVMLRRTFFTEFLHLMQRCRNPHGYEGESLRTYRLGVLRVKATATMATTTTTSTDAGNEIVVIERGDEAKPISDVIDDFHGTDIVLIPTTQIHPITDRLTDRH
jgi:hypothetical protein